MSIYLARNGKMLTRVNGTRSFGEIISPIHPEPTFDEVTIGSQTWMSKNLAVDDGQGGIYTKTVNYGQGDVTEYYYEWDSAVRVAATVSGWHLPTKAEWDSLETALGGSFRAGTKLKSTYGWYEDGNGTDKYRFCALPAGHLAVNGTNDNLYKEAQFWTSTLESTDVPYYRSIASNDSRLFIGRGNRIHRLSVRLIKDS